MMVLNARGQMFAGAIKKTELDGIYELLTVGSSQSAKTLMVTIFVVASAVDAVCVPADGTEQDLQGPGNGGAGIILPGMGH